jgi:ubiquinone/menaquinone biosynthesis C-methylase UbiE
MKSFETLASAKAWDAAAHGWNRHSHLIRAWLEEATAVMLDSARIGQGNKVLDIAAGAGDQTLDIARRVGPQGHVLATDISATILLLAAENARAAGLSNVATQVADAQALGLSGSNFDAAVCRLGLMFCHAPLDALKQARTALRPGGRFSAVVFSQPQHNPCIGLMMSTALRHAGLPPRSPYLPGSLLSLGEPGLLATLLQTAGFIDIKVHAMAAPFRLPTSRDYVDFVRTAGTPVMEILAALPPAAQRDAWDDMTEQLSVFATPTGWVGPNELLVCSATAPT